MTKFNALSNKLIQEAKNSTIQYRLAACIIQNGTPVCEPKCNDDRNYCRGHFCGSLHAEVRAMLTHFGTSINYDRKSGWRNVSIDSQERKAKKYDIFVVRINKPRDNVTDEPTLVNARPCFNCLNMMKSVGIRRVYYSDDSGNIIYENVRDMISIHTSKVAQRFEISKINRNGPLVNQNQINQTEYYDNMIKGIPNVMKQINYQYFVEYNFKSISDNYKLECKTNSGCMHVNIINMSNIILKTICIV